MSEGATYEGELARSTELTFREVDRFGRGESSVHRTLKELCSHLEADGIPYLVAGALALNCHGYLRVTVDIDIILAPEGLALFLARRLGRGYRPAFDGARKQYRATETGVRIDVFLAGEFPGDGHQQPVAFPSPTAHQVERDGIRYLDLPSLIDLKLASGMSAPHRLKDLADVQELIKAAALPRDLRDELEPYVRATYEDLWTKAQLADPHQG